MKLSSIPFCALPVTMCVCLRRDCKHVVERRVVGGGKRQFLALVGQDIYHVVTPRVGESKVRGAIHFLFTPNIKDGYIIRPSNLSSAYLSNGKEASDTTSENALPLYQVQRCRVQQCQWRRVQVFRCPSAWMTLVSNAFHPPSITFRISFLKLKRD